MNTSLTEEPAVLLKMCGGCGQAKPATLQEFHHHACRSDGLSLVETDVTIPELCPVLGIPMKINKGCSTSRDSSPSIDRFVPALGYVLGNVCVISLKANRIKNNGTPEELMAVALWYANKGTN